MNLFHNNTYFLKQNDIEYWLAVLLTF
jgi:hypothetical protein